MSELLHSTVRSIFHVYMTTAALFAMVCVFLGSLGRVAMIRDGDVERTMADAGEFIMYLALVSVTLGLLWPAFLYELVKRQRV